MPSRYVIAAIGVFWLATTAWLFQREIWPRLQPGEPPAFVIDLDDEVSEQKIFWTLSQDGIDMGYAQTWVQNQDRDDTFELASIYKLFTQGRRQQAEPDVIIQSSYWVSRDGELRRLHAHLDVPAFAFSGQADGTVDHGRLTPHLHLSGVEPFNGQPFIIDKNLATMEVPARGCMLNPRQPVNRLQGLRPGQRWWMPYWDPFESASGALIGKMPNAGLLEVHVADRLEPLARGPRTDMCLVAEYRTDDAEGHIWVRQSDGLVLRQDARYGKGIIVQTRDQP